MDFSLSEMQELLRTSARDFLKTSVPKSMVRQMAEDEKGYTPELWKQMGEMGWTGLVIPEAYGGAEASYLDLVILLEEMGRACLPGPFFSTVVLGGLTLMEAGSDEQKKEYLPALAEGKLLLTMALLEEEPGYSADAITMKAMKDGNDYILQGKKMFVPDANVSDCMICAVRTQEGEVPEEGITLLMVDSNSPGITLNLLKTISGDKQCEVIFDNVKVPAGNVLGQPDRGWQVLEKVLQKATIARCAEMVGAARAIFETTLDYARERKTFGHPIGSYQSIQHYCANMVTEADGCELVIHNVAWLLNEDQPAEQEVHMAKALTNDSFKRIAALCLQIHGGIGFTEEHDLPLYYKRAKAWEIDLGDTEYHLDKLADNAAI